MRMEPAAGRIINVDLADQVQRVRRRLSHPQYGDGVAPALAGDKDQFAAHSKRGLPARQAGKKDGSGTVRNAVLVGVR